MSNTGKQLKPPALFFGGMFEKNGERNPFANASIAYLPYCSSDAWVGDALPSNATFGYYFMGARIVAAAIASLVAEGLGAAAAAASTPPRLVFAGCSAGSRGAMMNLDYVPSMLESAGVAPGAVSVMGMLDSPLWIDAMQPMQPQTVSLVAQTQAVFALVNATGRTGTACAALYPGPLLWRCLFGQYRMPTLSTPYIMNAAADDRFQLSWNVGGNSTLGFTPAHWNSTERAYADAFATAMSAVIAGLPTSAQTATGSAVFSTACFRHCVTADAAFWNVAISPASLETGSGAGLVEPSGAPVSLRDAVRAWLDGKAPSRTVQACTGFRCGRCTTKLALAVKGGYTLPSPPPAPPAASAPEMALHARDASVALLGTGAAATVALVLAARAALQRAMQGEAPLTPDPAASSFAHSVKPPNGAADGL